MKFPEGLVRREAGSAEKSYFEPSCLAWTLLLELDRSNFCTASNRRNGKTLDKSPDRRYIEGINYLLKGSDSI